MVDPYSFAEHWHPPNSELSARIKWSLQYEGARSNVMMMPGVNVVLKDHTQKLN